MSSVKVLKKNIGDVKLKISSVEIGYNDIRWQWNINMLNSIKYYFKLKVWKEKN